MKVTIEYMRLRPKPERTSCWIPLGLMIIKNAATMTVDFNKGGLLSIKNTLYPLSM